ncbi:carboxypeptidase M32, partial [Candidatus Woesebacteria bacterium]|nr:carboxypeptidase M32 [Candidatus Woesebacteria bacterium]
MAYFSKNKTIASLVSISSTLRDISSALSLLLWDQETYLSPKGASIRATQLETLSGIYHEKATRKQIEKQLHRAQEELALHPEAFSIHDKALIKEMWRDYTLASKLPRSIVTQLSKHASLGLEAWKAARQNNDFSLFESELSIMVDLKRKVAEYIGYEESPYDALLDEYEEGLTKKSVETVFSKLKPELVTRIPTLVEQTRDYDTSLFHQTFDEETLWNFTLDILDQIGFDREAGRQDRSTHPFTMGMHPTDVRLTTRVLAQNPLSTLLSTIHEAGHGMYEQGISPELANTVLGRADSLVIHESQSRFWENMIGKSPEFWQWIFPRFQKAFPEQLRTASWQSAFKEVNTVSPSLIRVDADEVTYHLHIIIRFEIESALIEGRLNVHDVSAAWNEKYQEYLGISVPSASMGALQDIHWSQGLMGYFPTYSLGSLLSAQLYTAM